MLAARPHTYLTLKPEPIQQKAKNSLESSCSTILTEPERIAKRTQLYVYVFIMFLSKVALLIAFEAIVFLIIGNAAFVLLFLSQKKKTAALESGASQPNAASTKQPLEEKTSYQMQIEESLRQLSDSLPDLMPCSDPHAFAIASDQEQAKIIRYLVLDHEKQIIDNIEAENELAAPLVAAVNQLFPDTPGETPTDKANEAADKSESDINAEIEQLNNQNKMHQELISKFALESRDMLSCINTLENENLDLRKLIELKAGPQ